MKKSCAPPPVQIFLTLAVLCALLLLVRAQDDCQPLTLADLGSNTTNTTTGLVSQAADGNPALTIIDFNTLCLAQGTRRNTFSSATVLVRFRIADPLTDLDLLFFFTCFNRNWTIIGNTSVRNNMQNLQTPTDTSCFLCSLIGESSQPDPITFCHPCQNCEGLNLCTLDPDLPEQNCCNVFQDDVCAQSCTLPMVAGPTFDCILPIFEVNGVPFQSRQFTGVFVYDRSLTTLPLTIRSPYGNDTTWQYRDDQTMPPVSMNISTDTSSLLGGTRIQLSSLDELMILDPPQGIITIIISRPQTTPFELTILATGNPFLEVTPLITQLQAGETSFTLMVRSFFTLDGRNTVIVESSEFTSSVTSDMPVTVREGPPTSNSIVFNVDGDFNQLDVTIGWSRDGLSPSTTVQVLRNNILPVPDVVVIEEGANYNFSCTPTIPTAIQFSRNGVLLVVEEGATSVSVNTTATYTCSGFEMQVSRSTRLFVVPAGNVTLLDQNNSSLPNEHILNRNDELEGPPRQFLMYCFGSRGHERIRWGSDDQGIQENLDNLPVGVGEYQLMVDEAFPLGVEYMSVSGSNSVNFALLTVNTSSIQRPFDDMDFVRRFKCISMQSGAFKYVTTTFQEPYIFLPPPTTIPVTLGEIVALDFFLSRANTEDQDSYSLTLMEPGASESRPFSLPPSGTQRLVFEQVIQPNLNGTLVFRLTDGGGDFSDDVNFAFSITIPTLTLTSPITVNEGERFELMCLPSNPNVGVEWRFFSLEQEGGPLDGNNPGFMLSPAGLNHRLVSEPATISMDGNYSCNVLQNSIMRTTSVRVRQRCLESYAAGVFWPSSFDGDPPIRVRCSSIDPRFNNFVFATRTCMSRRVWSDVDFTPCTLVSLNVSPFIFIGINFRNPPISFSTALQNSIIAELSSLITTEGSLPPLSGSAQVNLSTALLTIAPRNQTEVVVSGAFSEIGVVVQPVLYRASLVLNSSSSINLQCLIDYWFQGERFLGGQEVFGPASVEGFWPSLECNCMRPPAEVSRPVRPLIPDDIPMRRRSAGVIEGPVRELAMICGGVAISPCRCFQVAGINNSSALSCSCQSPFLGPGGNLGCVMDSDVDGFPDVSHSVCSSERSSEFIGRNFCKADNCTQIYNPDQSINPCTTDGGGVECALDTDQFGIQWGFTPAGETVTVPCGSCCTGSASRVCGSDGVWMNSNVDNCLDLSFVEASLSLTDTIGQSYSLSTAETLLLDAEGLVVATLPQDGVSSFPSELESSAFFLMGAVDYLLLGVQDLDTNGTPLPTFNQSLPILNLLSNVVDLNNTMAAQEFSPDATFSQDLLNSAEGYGLYLSAVLEQQENGTNVFGAEMTVTADNILVNALSLDPDTQMENIVFPSASLISNNSGSVGSTILNRLGDASIVIPVSVLQQRLTMRPSGTVRVANILYQNLDQFFPSDSTSRTPVSVILSSQVEQQRSSVALLEPVSLTFTAFPSQTLLDQNSSLTYSCNFFDFTIDEFSTEGVVTVSVESVDNISSTVTVSCQTNHLTSFAILVNVGGQNVDSLALSIVSYIGLAISLVCLLLSIIFFLSFGKALFSAVHNFVHLNLALALFMAYLCFALGVELAASNTIACRVVTALLHYLFLAVFCWMLCEGVMLYLMLWVVFSNLSKKWWFFLLLGWLPPIIFVVIGLATVHEEYGITNDAGELVYCWLASGDGHHAIWAFVAPMLAIMLINVVFLVLVIISLIKSQVRKQKVQEDGGKRWALASSIIKASVILLPLLGLTWVFGLLIVNRVAVVFAWIFAICNTLQGALFFFFHVLRNERIWGRFKKKYNLFQSTTAKSSNSQGLYKKTVGTDSTNAYVSLKEKNTKITDSTKFGDSAKFGDSTKLEVEEKTALGDSVEIGTTEFVATEEVSSFVPQEQEKLEVRNGVTSPDQHNGPDQVNQATNIDQVNAGSDLQDNGLPDSNADNGKVLSKQYTVQEMTIEFPAQFSAPFPTLELDPEEATL